MRTPYIHHVTLTSGDVRHSPRHEVGGEAIEVCRELIGNALKSGPVPVPGFPAYDLRARRFGGRCLVVEIAGISGVVVTAAIAAHSRCGAALWAHMHDGRAELATARRACPPEPWCAARLESGVVGHRDAMQWVGDLERCLAWAWMQMQ